MTGINIRKYLHEPKENECAEEIRLTQDDRDEILEAFTLYDKDGDGFIEVTELATVFRALGQTPTVCEEIDMVARYAQDKCTKIDFMEFLKLATNEYRTFDEDDELRETFRRFDKEDRGFIRISELRSLLTTKGEPLTEEEVDDWLQDSKAFQRSGKIYYEHFATFMLSK